MQSRLKQASGFSFEVLLQRHQDDYHKLYQRVRLDLGETEASITNLPMEKRLVLYREGGKDPDLEEAIFQYGRYLMIGSSRPGTLPANLQGVWNNRMNPPWRGDYHLNINIQMNYWLTGSTNLLECQEPLIDLLELLQKNGRKTAQAYFNADGWTAMLTSNIWGYTAPNYTLEGLQTESKPGKKAPMYWSFFSSGGPWVAFHAYDHYSFGQDPQMLKDRLWPIVSGSADFVVDFLYKLPEGKYSDVPSWSPEHGSISKGATAEIATSREILKSALHMAEVLGIEDERTAQYSSVMDNLLPYQIGQHGQLQEWYEDWDNPKDKHRHVSHLIGLHPGSQISPLTTPELAQATRTTLSQRSGMSTGWSLAWEINLMARLFEGNEAYALVRMLLESRVSPNLWAMHPPFQIDANFGATAGIAEMLLQSHLGEIHVLPALPDAWPSGSVTGLRARGGFTVDITWDKGKLTQLKIHSDQGASCKVRYTDRVTDVKIPRGQVTDLDGSLQPTL
ncbi:MAG: hypothetical protein HC888_03555 [Candidatus Competibacteraceae bacterium]|nr:hypothetical protein [Candidatus Competibacteraceae bacterium]